MSIRTASVSAKCDDVIARYNLLEHTFYRRWTDGTLPVRALKDYAREYGLFIRIISQGWEAVGYSETARVEDAHAQIWEKTFADGLGTSIAPPEITEVAGLLALSRELFQQRDTALGALYGFEAQQPVVARAKLRGLREHYPQLPHRCGEYFRLHTDEYDEPLLLANEMNALHTDNQERAMTACERMCQGLYNALSGIHAPYVEHSFSAM